MVSQVHAARPSQSSHPGAWRGAGQPAWGSRPAGASLHQPAGECHQVCSRRPDRQALWGNHHGGQRSREGIDLYSDPSQEEEWLTRITYTCARPPSTNSSIPVIKLLSSEARNSTALATSSGAPMRPIGVSSNICTLNCSASSFVCPTLFPSGVSIMPGLMALTRILRPFKSSVQVRAKDRTAALAALKTLTPSPSAVEAATPALRMTELPLCKSGSAFCTVKRPPFTSELKVLLNCSSEISPNGATSPPPALAKSTSTRPCCRLTRSYKRSRSARFETSPCTAVTCLPICCTALSSSRCRRPVM